MFVNENLSIGNVFFFISSIPEVSAGCTASCESNPCQNQAKCIEHWGSYTCICTNRWAHWGDSCERSKNCNSMMKI